ncbi:MAG: hypothetical protein IPG33_02870 [Betaproteobacteria bacterium]|nr:hypothetical protein [Betaproteobacteria bacterium]
MLKTLLIEELRFLAFRPNGLAIRTHWKAFLVFGLFFTWLAGVGRFWDNPKAHLCKIPRPRLRCCIFVLAFIVFLLLLPLKPRNWTYRNVLLFIALTAPPAVLYAIPVEKFMAAEAARTAPMPGS